MSAMTRLRFATAMIAALMSTLWASAAEAQAEKADLALVLAVDVSGSVTEERFALQMEGIARAFEDEAVHAAILSGPHRAIFATLVEWSDRATDVVPWRLIASADDARAFAASIRRAPRADDQFTCMAAALNVISGKVLPFLPAPAQRTIVDVSGDGHDNCNPATKVDTVRDALVASGVTINGLPILEGDEAKTLESWYRDHVVGGPGAFLAPALGFKDFGRAMRRKFLVEISSVPAARVGG